MTRFALIAAGLLLSGCTKTVVEYRDVIVKVQVPVPCVEEQYRPTPVAPVREAIPREVWDAMSTDQRQAKLLANGMRRVAYEHEAEVVLIACESVIPAE